MPYCSVALVHVFIFVCCVQCISTILFCVISKMMLKLNIHSVRILTNK